MIPPQTPPFDTQRGGDLLRIEHKVDRLSDAIEKLVLIEERQTTQGGRINSVEQRTTALELAVRTTDSKVDKWVNRGIGVWAFAAALYALLKTVREFA
jgi:hypothetical protein